MKRVNIFNLVLPAIVCGFMTVAAACDWINPKDDPEPAKSAECDIISFKTGDVAWEVNSASFSIARSFPKNTPKGTLTPEIEVSENATVSPKSGVAQDFFASEGVTYTVTAEDGINTKTYTARATVLMK